jgi:hypothetical protein
VYQLDLPAIVQPGAGVSLPAGPQPRLGPEGGERINRPFPGWPLDAPQFGDKASSPNLLTSKIADLSLPSQVNLRQLPTLPVTAMGIVNRFNLDSVRSAWLSAERLRLKEKQLSSIRKDVLLKEKAPLTARTFFDGVIGINNRAEFVTFSPAAGIGITRRIAAGLGPIVGVNSKNVAQPITWGFRSFARYELLRKKLNLQVEDIGDISRLSTGVLRETGGKRLNHTFYAGAGYLFNYSKYKSITINTLYQLNRVRQSPSLYSPFLFRIGFSAFHHKHKQL